MSQEGTHWGYVADALAVSGASGSNQPAISKQPTRDHSARNAVRDGVARGYKAVTDGGFSRLLGEGNGDLG